MVSVCEAPHAVSLDALHTVNVLYVLQLEHCRHEDAPPEAADEYVPSAHETQPGLPSRLSAYMPRGQFWHAEEEVLPSTAEYVPAEHAVHCELPSDTEKLPAGHCMQLVLAGETE
jgi:hypothetical protein